MLKNAADWAEICQLKSAYGWHYDAPDFEALVDLFTDDAVCVFGAWKIAHMQLTFLWNSDVGRIRPGQERKLDWHADAAAGVSE
jgi:hypothetical protein